MTLVELARIVVRKWRTVAIVTIAFVVVTAGVVFLMRPVYRATVTLSPVAESPLPGGLAEIAGQLAGLTALAGLDLGAEDEVTRDALAILQSRAFAAAFISDLNLLPMIFASDWDPEDEQWRVTRAADIPTMQDAFEVFDEDIRRVGQDRRTGLITVSVDWYDPETAAKWANLMVERVNDTARQSAIDQAQARLGYLREELEETSILELQQAIYRLIEQQIQAETMARSRREYAFRVIDPAVPPDLDRFEWPKRGLMIFGGACLGLAIGILVALGREGRAQL